MTETCLITRLPNESASQVVSVFCEAFHGYPVMRYVLGDAAGYDERLKLLIRLFVSARVLRNEPIFGAQQDGQLVAAMTTSVPDDNQPSPQFRALREGVWRELGPEAEARYTQCTSTWEHVGVEAAQVHVNMIGVRPAFQKTGLARRLLHEAHELSRSSQCSEGVSLTTEDRNNVAFYEHLGYEIVGQGSITPEITTWGFFRRNAG